MSTEILSPSSGARQLKTAHAAATEAHKPVVLASGIVAIPTANEDAGVENLFDYEVECVVVDKATGQAWTGGAVVYWDDAAKNFTTTSTANTKCGRIIADAESSADRGQIRLTSAV